MVSEVFGFCLFEILGGEHLLSSLENEIFRRIVGVLFARYLENRRREFRVVVYDVTNHVCYL